MVEVTVVVHLDSGAAQAASVDDRRVVELVGADEHAWRAERREDAEVCREPGREEHGALGALPVRQRRFEVGVHGARAHDQTSRAGPRPPPVERGVRRGHDQRVLREPEVVVRREGHDGAAVGEELPLGPGGVEVARLAPATGVADGGGSGAGPVAPAHAAATSSIATDSASTIRRSWGEVIVSGGITTTTSPRGRSSTPRSTAAAQTRRPQRRPSRGGASSTPPMSPCSRTSRTARCRATRSSSKSCSSVDRARTLASTSRSSRSSRWRRATAHASAFPPYEWPWYSVRSERSGPRNASNTRWLATVADWGR